jgi:hypothetical protein
MSNGSACCLLLVCCDRRSPKYKAAMMKEFKQAGLDDASAETAYTAMEPYDLVPAGTLDAYRNAITAEARKHPDGE